MVDTSNPVSFKVWDLADNIFFFVFETQAGMNAAFLRPAEYYESPHFEGKVFTFEEYIPWYIAHSPNGKKTGEFTYFSDWNGHNLSSDIFEVFVRGNFDPLNTPEQQVIDILKTKQKPFYVLAAHKEINPSAVMDHEIAHALYYVDLEYRKEMQEVVDRHNTSKLEQLLRDSAAYSESVIPDELQAHGVHLETPAKVKLGYVESVSEEFKKECRGVFNKYRKKHSINIPTLEQIMNQ